MSRLEIIESEADFKRALREIERAQWISYDIEGSGLNPFDPDAFMSSIGIGTLLKDFTFPLNHYKSRLFGYKSLQKKRIKLLSQAVKNTKKIAHNGKFDSLFIKCLFDEMWYCDFDTMLAHYNLNENERHGLKAISIKYLDADEYDIPLTWKQGIEGPLDKHCEYLGYDCNYTFRLRRIFLRMLNKEPTAKKIFTHLTMPLSHLYTRVELRGVPIDETKLADGKKYWEERVKSSEKQLRKMTKGFTPEPNAKGKIPEINFGSTKQLRKLLFEDLELTPLDKTPKGEWSTSESVLKRLDHPIGQVILDNREAIKNLSTFIDSWKSRLVDGRIHPTFKIHGTVTGRPSCAEPNLQQTPRDPRIRSIIDAPKGWVLAEADYSQAELRIAADLANEPTLLKIYQEGGDVHTMTVQQIFKIKKPTAAERKKGKAVNFGFIYGMWWKKFGIYARDNYGVTFTPKESENIRKAFFKMYILEPWHKKQKQLANAQGYVMNKIGRKRRLPNALIPDTGRYNHHKAEAERQAINSPVQSLASDINLLAAIEIDKTIPHDYCQIVGTVHDSNLMLIREDKVDKVCKQIFRIMENPYALTNIFSCKLKVPLVAEIKLGAWSQGVEYER